MFAHIDIYLDEILKPTHVRAGHMRFAVARFNSIGAEHRAVFFMNEFYLKYFVHKQKCANALAVHF